MSYLAGSRTYYVALTTYLLCAEVERVRVDDLLAEQDPWAMVLPRADEVAAAANR